MDEPIGGEPADERDERVEDSGRVTQVLNRIQLVAVRERHDDDVPIDINGLGHREPAAA